MGMTIDEATLYMELYKREIFNSVSDLDKDIEAYDMAISTMRKYQQLQADYETRLKADMVAVLEDLRLQFEEYEPKWVENDEQAVASCRTWEDLDELIQEKINSLMEVSDGDK